MPFSIRRLTLQRSLSGGERPKSEPPGRAAIKKSASQDEARAARALPSSRSADQGDLRRLQALGQAPSPAQGSPLQHHEPAQPQQQPPEPPARNWSPQMTSGGGRYPTRAVSVDRATSSSSSLLSRWRQVGRSKSASISEPREYPLDDGNAKPTPPPRPPRSAASRLSAAGSKGPADWSGGGGGGVVAGHTVRRPVPRRQHSLPETQEQQLQRSIMELQSHLGAPVGGGGGGRMVGPPMYQPPASVYDEDPGIMSEVETSATGLRRATKARASLPVVRTPSKTQERPLARMTLVKPGELGDWQDGKGNRYKEDYRTSMSPSGGVYVNNELASRAAMMTSLGLVFLQYRSETKRALLPNEITSIDTVKALFVRSFPKQLTMEYLDSPHIRIYIHDPSKDMFYGLEDLRDIRDRSVIRIYEQDVNDGGVYSTYDQDMSYFSEPEFDSEYQNQHIHRAKAGKSQGAGYYGVPAYPAPGRTQTLPHGATIRPFSPAPQERPKPSPGYSQTLPRGMTYSSVALSPEKRQPGLLVTAAGPPGVAPAKPQRFYGQPPPPLQVASPLTSPRSPLPRPVPPPPRALSPDRGGGLLAEAGYPPVVGAPFPAGGVPTGPYPPPTSPRRYDLAGYPPADDRGRGDPGYSPERRLDHTRSLPATFNSAYEEPFYGGDAAAAYGSRSGSATPIIDEEARMRVEYMERQLAGLTGLVHKALAAGTSPRQPSHLIPTRDTDVAPEKDRSEEKSVSFSDETLDCHKQRQHSPQPAAEKPTKPAIKGMRSHSISDDYSGVTSAIPDKDGRPSKPAPPPKPASLSCALESRQHSSSPAKEIHFSVEACSRLQLLRKQTRDLRLEVRNLRRMTQTQAVTAREMIRETCLKIKVMLAAVQVGEDQVCAERLRVSREEDLYRQDVTRLEKDLSDLESQVEELRGNVINRRCRVNMSNVESMALVLSRASKTVADLKARFPNLQESLKSVMGAEMEVVVREEKFLKEEPERLENALRRCKKLTGTLVTLKRLASVQEQRHTGAHTLPEKAASADGPYSGGEAHTARSSRQAWKWSSDFREKIDLWRGYSTLGWSDKTCDATAEPAGGAASDSSKGSPAARSENALDALLDELQTFSKPADKRGGRPLSADSPVRASSSSASVGSAKPPSGATVVVVDGPGSGGVNKKTPPPPPPRTTSKSPVTSPTGPQRSRSEPVRTNALAAEDASSSSSGSSGGRRDQLSSNSSSSESVNSQEGLQARSRQELLDSRHQELLRKQRQLQEQYARLQLLQRLSPPKPDLKKTGSESNILHKASLSLGSAGGASGSLTHLAVPSSALRTGAKIYETDIL